MTMVAYLKFRVAVPADTDVAYTVYELYEGKPLAVDIFCDTALIYEVSDRPFEDAMPYEVRVALVGEPLMEVKPPIFPVNRLVLYTGQRWVLFPLLSPPLPYDYATGFGVFLGQVLEPTDPLAISANPPAPLYLLTYDYDVDGWFDVWAVYLTYEEASAVADGAGVALLRWDGLVWAEGVCDNAHTVMFTKDGAVYSTEDSIIIFEDETEGKPMLEV